ncbi:aminofutalosine synthase MqnE [Rugosimonospora africana]|uniref:Aminodeoxyfutalosine synthase n=1 Tax=Rugosimonospora africana TaxID=556532 RepID=A0A8J3QLZ9_9ACTN|nr:aminofutalosine synthase MqnE [Rugosimonospora africana]GIH13428.1 aminodeoxyfutalosine synthase [Rugosimonospora africana]
MDAGLKRELEDKVSAGERLTRADGEALYASDDLVWLGRLAHQKRTERNGDRVMFNVNRHLGLEEAVATASELRDEQLTELHIAGGLHPTQPWEYYPRVLRELKAALPDVALKAFAATEIHWFEGISGLPAEEILDELIDAGLESLTGGGAEIFDSEHAAHWDDWSRIHRLAHAKGMKTPSTMLYGHAEEPRHRVDHVLRLRELQDETGGFQVFSPLRYRHDFVDPADGTGRDRPQVSTPMAEPAESLKTFAISRLLFDNVPHVKSWWVAHGLSVTQLSLNFGADDLDGSAVEYEITHDADGHGAPHPMHREDLLNLIWDGGFQPVERNTRYEVVREYEPPVPLAQRRAEPQRVWA